MKNAIHFLLCFLLISTVLSGCTSIKQTDSLILADTTPETKPLLKPYVAEMSEGSAKSLTGKCVLVNIFISDVESSYTADEKNVVFQKLKTVKTFLEKNASQYYKDLTIIYDENDLKFDMHYPKTIPMDLKHHSWPYKVLKNIHAENIYKEILKKYDTKNVGFIINVNKQGIPYTLAYNKRYAADYFYEPSILYASSYDIDTSPYYYAHEIMHLFGAADLYYPRERKKYAEKLFPDDIMLNYKETLDDCLISDVDAYLVGWCDGVDKKHRKVLKANNK